MATASSSPASSSCLVQNYGRNPVRFVRGRGVFLEDDRGQIYLDAFAGVAVSALGHGHALLSACIADQAARLIHVSNHYQIIEQETAAARIVASAFPGKVLFGNSGAEANEAAYKTARLWGNVAHGGRKTRMLACTGSFHGRTIGALSLTHTAKYRDPFAPLPATEFLPFGDLAAATATIRDDVAAVFVEPIQGESGVHVPPPGYLAGLRALCDQHGALLVFDEIQTGVGRTGRMWCHQHENVIPDLMTMAKGLGGGVPIGALLVGPRADGLLQPGLHGTTFGGNPLACAAAACVLDHVTAPGFLARVAATGDRLAAGLRRLFPGRTVRGRGLLLGVALDFDPALLVRASFAHGLIVGPSGGNTLRLAPPLIITADEVDDLLARLARAQAEVRAA